MAKRYIECETLIKNIKKHKVAIVFKSGLVSEDEVKEAMLKQGEQVQKAIEETPTADVVEVTHCENCNCFELMTSNNQHFCNQFGGYVTENDYCSRPSPKNRKE